MASGKKLTLPAGKYEVATDIWNTADNTDTLVSKAVTVSGSTTATLDARGGVPLAITLDHAPPSGLTEQFGAQLCVNGMSVSGTSSYGWPGEYFVKPTTDKNIDFAYMSEWSAGPQSTSDLYAVAGIATGIPTKPAFAFKTSSLANVEIQARSGPESGSSVALNLAPDPESGNCEVGLIDSFSYYNGAPGVAINAHVNVGRWSLDASTSNADNADLGYWQHYLTVAAGKSYQQLFYHAALGPSGLLPTVEGKTLRFSADQLFSDSYADGFEGRTQATSTLSYGSKVIATHTGNNYGNSTTDLAAKLSASGWYTLTSTATRYDAAGGAMPANMQSPKATVSFHFNLNMSSSATTPGIYTRFVPTSLNLANAAKVGATTTINLHMNRVNDGPTLPSETVKTVVAWYSTDNGSTWHKVTTTKTGTYYTVKVPDAAAGGVSLRSEVTDTKGNSTTTTVYRAYAIG